LQYKNNAIIRKIVILTLALFINYFPIIIKFKAIALSNIPNDIIISIIVKLNSPIINNKRIIIIFSNYINFNNSNVFKALPIVGFTKVAIVIYLYLKLIEKLTAILSYNKYFAKLYK